MLDSEEQPQGNRDLNEGSEYGGQKRRASFLIDLFLLERYSLDRDRIHAHTSNLLEFISELHQTWLVGCEPCGGTEGANVEWYHDESREKSCSNDRPEPRHAGGNLDQFHGPLSNPRWCPMRKPEGG